MEEEKITVPELAACEDLAKITQFVTGGGRAVVTGPEGELVAAVPVYMLLSWSGMKTKAMPVTPGKQRKRPRSPARLPWNRSRRSQNFEQCWGTALTDMDSGRIGTGRRRFFR